MRAMVRPLNKNIESVRLYQRSAGLFKMGYAQLEEDESSGSVTVRVDRIEGTQGPASVSYFTRNLTAIDSTSWRIQIPDGDWHLTGTSPANTMATATKPASALPMAANLSSLKKPSPQPAAPSPSSPMPVPGSLRMVSPICRSVAPSPPRLRRASSPSAIRSSRATNSAKPPLAWLKKTSTNPTPPTAHPLLTKR